MFRAAVGLLAVLAVGAGAAYGLRGLEKHLTATDAMAAAPTSVRVRLSPIPSWMPWSLACDIAGSVLDANADFLDASLTRVAHDRLAACPWVRSVGEVRKQHTADPLVGVLEMQATFREPVALVALADGRSYAFVDEEGVRLPDEPGRPGAPRWRVTVPGSGAEAPREVACWDKLEAPRGLVPRPIHYIFVEGVQAAPPVPGQRWAGQDLADGLRLVGLLRGRKYADQIVAVDVRNFGGRVSGNSARPHITIRARGRGGESVEVGFGRFPNPRGDYILGAERRLANLDDYIARCGGWFGVHRRVDLQYDRVHAE